MFVSVLAVVALARQGGLPKPPEAKYDAAHDVTTYSTGDVRTAGFSGYGARYEFPGKTPRTPASIGMGFGALRVADADGSVKDEALLHWTGVKTISISFGGQTQDFSAVHEFKVSTNKSVTLFLGHALEESLSISLTPAQFRSIAAADVLRVHLGQDTQDIRGKSLVPLKKLAACIPPS